MWKTIRHWIKKMIYLLPIPLTKNEVYDRLTEKIINRICSQSSVCIDVGANQGRILQMFCKAAPLAKHFAFEPVPTLYEQLVQQFKQNAIIWPLAISHQKGYATFNTVPSNWAYSGFHLRADKPFLKAKTITVPTDLLDNIIPPETNITIIKIDVEGAELWVLKGAIRLIQHSKPIILFEFGKAGATIYSYNNTNIWHFFESAHYHLYTLQHWLQHKKPLSITQFEKLYTNGKEYFFIATPQSS